jgi:hypothetical protein
MYAALLGLSLHGVYQSKARVALAGSASHVSGRVAYMSALHARCTPCSYVRRPWRREVTFERCLTGARAALTSCDVCVVSFCPREARRAAAFLVAIPICDAEQ